MLHVLDLFVDLVEKCFDLIHTPSLCQLDDASGYKVYRSGCCALCVDEELDPRRFLTAARSQVSDRPCFHDGIPDCKGLRPLCFLQRNAILRHLERYISCRCRIDVDGEFDLVETTVFNLDCSGQDLDRGSGVGDFRSKQVERCRSASDSLRSSVVELRRGFIVWIFKTVTICHCVLPRMKYPAAIQRQGVQLVVVSAARRRVVRIHSVCVGIRSRNPAHCRLKLELSDLVLHVSHAVSSNRVEHLLHLCSGGLVDGCGVDSTLILHAVDRSLCIAAAFLHVREASIHRRFKISDLSKRVVVGILDSSGRVIHALTDCINNLVVLSFESRKIG
uniref:Uncharacterized protein n=1 Tax=Myoviridae sp. ctiBE32 TaxID=2826685 RepID=A0A8S5N8W5_9CAUD|nr:MAG TPA: hypothetical protein [Myoviridae sp. ctiBE32]